MPSWWEHCNFSIQEEFLSLNLARFKANLRFIKKTLPQTDKNLLLA